MTDVAKLQLIEAYYSGTLSETQQVELSNLLATDAEFPQELQDYNSLLDGFNMLTLESFEDQLSSWETKYQNSSVAEKDLEVDNLAKPTQKSQMRKLRIYIAIAAAITAIAFMPFAYSLFVTTPDLYADMFTTPDAILTSNIRGSEDITVKEKEKSVGLTHYNRNEFVLAVSSLTTYVENYGAQEYEALLYLGISQMAIKQFQKASMNLELVAESGGMFHAQTAQWMLVLTQYKIGNESVAIKLAKDIITKPTHSNYADAVKFLAKIEK